MLVKLRIFFTILSAICVAAVIPVGALLGFPWAITCVVLAFALFMIVLLLKSKQESLENPPPENPKEKTDFLHPKQEKKKEEKGKTE